MFRETVSFRDAEQYITAACRRKNIASVAAQQMAQWHVCRSRLLRCDARSARLLLEYPDPVSDPAPLAFEPGQSLAIKFISRDHRLLFMADVELVHDTPSRVLPVRALEVSIPDEITCINQRNFFRARIPGDRPLKLSMWEIGMQRWLQGEDDDPSVYRGEALNISIGGVLAGHFPVKPPWEAGAHLGVRIPLLGAGTQNPPRADSDGDNDEQGLTDEPVLNQETTLLLNAEIRHRWVHKEHGLCFGLAFIGAETMHKTLAAQEKLARLVAEYQRLWLGRRVN